MQNKLILISFSADNGPLSPQNNHTGKWISQSSTKSLARASPTYDGEDDKAYFLVSYRNITPRIVNNKR